jgi:tetratricopeptide (TPR) repeat protein
VQAEPPLARGLELSRRVLGEEHLTTLMAMNALGLLYRAQHKYAQAEPLFTKLLDLCRSVLGEDHPDTLAAMGNLGTLYQVQGKYAHAEPLLAKALALSRRVLGEEHPNTQALIANMWTQYRMQDKYTQLDGAEPGLREGLNDYEKDGWLRYLTQSRLGESLADQRRYTEAEPLLLSGYGGMIQRVGAIPRDNLSEVETAGDRIVQLYQDWGKPEQAAEWRARLFARKTEPFVKVGDVIQDPDAPISFRLAPGWILKQSTRGGVHQTMLTFAETKSQITAYLYYDLLQGPYPADTDAALREGMEDKVRERRGREGMKDYRIRPGSVQMRLVGDHPAISFIGEYALHGQSLADYTVQVLGKSIRAEFEASNPPAADIDDFRKRFDLIVDSLRIP